MRLKPVCLVLMLVFMLTASAFTLTGCGGAINLQGETLDQTYPHRADISKNSASNNLASKDSASKDAVSGSMVSENTVSEEAAASTEVQDEIYDVGRDDSGTVSEENVPTVVLSGDSADMQEGELKVSGSHITDRNGDIVRLRGVSTHGINWYPEYVSQDAFHTLKTEWNVNLVRIAMYTDQTDGYCSLPDNRRADLRNLMDSAVSAASNEGMYVIIDWHTLQDGNPNLHIEDAKEYFSYLAEKYQNSTNVIYEICNEPNGSTSWSDIKSYASQIIPIIRAKSDAVIIVGTPNWCQYVDEAADDPLPYDNVVYALHFYAATHKKALQDKLDYAEDKGLPVFVSEFGICDAAGSGAVDINSADTWMQLLDKYGIGSCIWNLSNKNETSALILPSCDRTSGWTYDELSKEGQWYYDRK